MADEGMGAEWEAEVDGDTSAERSKLLWNQQFYILENIKLADTKAGFVLTISAALLSSTLSPTGHLAVHLGHAVTARGYVRDGAEILGVGLLVAAVLCGVWSIMPRLRSHAAASPVSWVNVAQYPDADRFRSANRRISPGMAADYLCDQVFHMSRICVRKHWLVKRAVMAALGGAICIGVALIAR